MWRTQFIKHLVQTNKALVKLYKTHNYYDTKYKTMSMQSSHHGASIIL